MLIVSLAAHDFAEIGQKSTSGSVIFGQKDDRIRLRENALFQPSPEIQRSTVRVVYASTRPVFTSY